MLLKVVFLLIRSFSVKQQSMSCLAHDKRFRSLFHNIINELRNENRTPVSIIRIMPSKCCTCNDESKETIEPVIMKEENQLIKLKNLIERVNREKQSNSKLILSLNRFEHLIEENRSPDPVTSELVSGHNQEKISVLSDDSISSIDYQELAPSKHQVKSERVDFSSSSDVSSSASHASSSSSDSEDDLPRKHQTKPIKIVFNLSSCTSSSHVTPMEVSKPNVRSGKKQKPIKNGTFLFLPYTFEGKAARKKTDSLLEVAKKLQRSRFIGRNGHVVALEKQYDVRINMITPKTSNQVTEALEKAKQGLENLTIRNQKESMILSEKQEGEWILVRSKKPLNQTNTANIDQLLDDLTNRWETCLQIKKRKSDEADNSDDSNQKRK
jgi:hypothetical protein